ncbi:MAG TPA: Hsp33 family molecular chaperone HslO [Polyangia bacterium]|nr:Hsp33 family molecular chaperone HslO [Polyangia bacterium]
MSREQLSKDVVGDDGGDSVADEIVRAVIDGRPVRIVAVTSTEVAREAARRHGAGPAASLALARGLTAGLLLATLTKDDERVTLQVLGDGPLGGLTVDATASGTARAYVKNPGVPLVATPGTRASLAVAVGRHGLVSVIRDVGLGEAFSGRTSIATGEIDEDVERYLEASEQIVSALACDAALAPDGTIAFAAGILVQALPGSDGAVGVAAARGLVADGQLLRALGTGPRDGGAVIAAVLGDHLGQVRILDRRAVRFDCPCSRARASTSLALLGEPELAAMILDDGRAEVTCNFCRARYEFDEAALEVIRRETAKPAGPPS